MSFKQMGKCWKSPSERRFLNNFSFIFNKLHFISIYDCIETWPDSYSQACVIVNAGMKSLRATLADEIYLLGILLL
jgi:hypothetical protein